MWFRKRKIYFTNALPPPPVELIHWIQFESEDMDVGLEEVTNKDKNDKIGKGNADICTGYINNTNNILGLGEGLFVFFKGLELLFQSCALAQ